MSAKGKQIVELKTEDIILARTVAEKFNISSGASSARRVSKTVGLAAEFLTSVVDDIIAGGSMYTGSEWHGPDLFLDKSTAEDIGNQKDTALDAFKKLPVTKKVKADLEKVRKAFNLKSDRHAASLCLKVYKNLRDGAWRGNGFWIETEDGKDKVFNIKKIAPRTKVSKVKVSKTKTTGSKKTSPEKAE